MARGKYFSLEEARKQDRLDRLAGKVNEVLAVSGLTVLGCGGILGARFRACGFLLATGVS